MIKNRGGGYNAVTSVYAFNGNAVATAAPSGAFDRTLCGLSGVSGASPDKRFGENDIPNHSWPTLSEISDKVRYRKFIFIGKAGEKPAGKPFFPGKTSDKKSA